MQELEAFQEETETLEEALLCQFMAEYLTHPNADPTRMIAAMAEFIEDVVIDAQPLH